MEGAILQEKMVTTSRVPENRDNLASTMAYPFGYTAAWLGEQVPVASDVGRVQALGVWATAEPG